MATNAKRKSVTVRARKTAAKRPTPIIDEDEETTDDPREAVREMTEARQAQAGMLPKLTLDFRDAAAALYSMKSLLLDVEADHRPDAPQLTAICWLGRVQVFLSAVHPEAVGIPKRLPLDERIEALREMIRFLTAHTEAQGQLSEQSRVSDPDPGPRGWDIVKPRARLANEFGISDAKMKTMLDSKAIRFKAMGDRGYMVAIDDLPKPRTPRRTQ
jgi:hypothetical protein